MAVGADGETALSVEGYFKRAHAQQRAAFALVTQPQIERLRVALERELGLGGRTVAAAEGSSYVVSERSVVQSADDRYVVVCGEQFAADVLVERYADFRTVVVDAV